MKAIGGLLAWCVVLACSAASVTEAAAKDECRLEAFWYTIDSSEVRRRGKRVRVEAAMSGRTTLSCEPGHPRDGAPVDVFEHAVWSARLEGDRVTDFDGTTAVVITGVGGDDPFFFDIPAVIVRVEQGSTDQFRVKAKGTDAAGNRASMASRWVLQDVLVRSCRAASYRLEVVPSFW